MILLHNDEATSHWLVVGSGGLIGSAIVRDARRRLPRQRTICQLAWHDPDQLRRQFASFADRFATKAGTRTSRLAIVWSAGRAGFPATESECEAERQAFALLLDMTGRIHAVRPDLRMHFCLVSSAGGLFEGQRRVTDKSNPSPRRAYGRLKLQQEQMLRDCPFLLSRHIVRPSSVYGCLADSRRRGLIPTLIHNGMLNRETVVFANPQTLRDYVWVDDVARVVRNSLEEIDGGVTQIVASGRPMSIREIQSSIEERLQRRLSVRIRVTNRNEEDITFSPQVVRPRSAATDFTVAIGRIIAEFAKGGLCLVP